MVFKLPLYTARVNGAPIFASPILCKDDPDAERIITEIVKEGNPDGTVEDLHCCGYFDVFSGTLEVFDDEETSDETEVE